jgi:putative NADPH-quinone reductase
MTRGPLLLRDLKCPWDAEQKTDEGLRADVVVFQMVYYWHLF